MGVGRLWFKAEELLLGTTSVGAPGSVENMRDTEHFPDGRLVTYTLRSTCDRNPQVHRRCWANALRPMVLLCLGRPRPRSAAGRRQQSDPGRGRRSGAEPLGSTSRGDKAVMGTHKFEITDYLRTDRQIAAYLDAALADGDPRVLLAAVRDVAAVRGGMAALARRAGIPRESLYRMLSRRGNPSYAAVRSILDAAGFRLSVLPGRSRERKSRRAA